jgi:putative RecB family exonuclease
MKSFPTALETFRNCPRKYAFDQDPEVKKAYRKPTVEQFIGTCIHDALERFFDVRKTPIPARTYETLVQHLREAWSGKDMRGKWGAQRREERATLFGADRETEAAAGEKAKHLLWGFCKTQDLRAVPATAEAFHEIPFGGGRHVLAGKIDRVDREGDALKVVDYKTGKGKTVEQVRADDLQLAAYALIVGRKFRVPVSRCSMIYLQESREVGFEPDREWLAGKEEALLGLLDGIEAERARPDGPDKFPPTPNTLCAWCDYRPLCPEGREFLEREEAAAGAVPEGEPPPF